MAMRFLLSNQWAKVIHEAPEAGMGYCIATVKTSLGEVFEHVVIDSGWVVDVPGYGEIPFTLEQITAIQVTNDKSKYQPRGN